VSIEERYIDASPDDVFRVFSDGWSYPSWVVGASRVRAVEKAWPAAGAKISHSFGVWPAVIDDTTSIIEWEPPHRVVLIARGWPMGEARVAFALKPVSGGTHVTMVEDAVSGPGALVPHAIQSLLLRPRNRETLRRLAWLSEGYREGTTD
jgi:uncharacterized protein YndB with AHSA1/START domain